MSFENNLVNTTTLTIDELVSTDRPVIIDFEYTGTGQIPRVCEVQCWGNLKGAWTKIGSPLFANRTSESTAADPKFRLDFSEIIGRNLTDSFKESYNVSGATITTWIPSSEANSVHQQKNDSTHNDAEGTTSCKFEAFAWGENSQGLLERTDEAAVEWNSSYVNPVEISLPASHINKYTSFSNIRSVASGGGLNGVIDGRTEAFATSVLSPHKINTNCPRSYRRIIPQNAGLPLSLITYGKMNQLAYSCYFEGTLSAGGTVLDAETSLKVNTAGSESSFLTYLTPLVNLPTLLTSNPTWSQLRDDFQIELRLTTPASGAVMDTLLFTNSSTISPDSKLIYWINDSNCLDFLLFDGGTKVVYENSSESFVRNKDYSVRRESSRGILGGSSTEVITVKSPLLNREARTWLMEIGRSKRVFEYDLRAAVFIPILVENDKHTLFDSSQSNLFIELTYTKDTTSTI